MRRTARERVGLGSCGVRLTGVVQEEYQRDSPGQHGVPSPHQHPWAEQRPKSHGLGPPPQPTRKKLAGGGAAEQMG